MSEKQRRTKGGSTSLGGGPRGMVPGEKAKNFGASMKQLFRYMGKYKIKLIVVFLFAIGSTIFSIVGPKILGRATTELFTGLQAKLQRTGSIDFESIGQTLLLVLGLYVISAIFAAVQGYIMSDVSNDVAYSLRKEVSGKMNRIPLQYFENKTHGEVLSRVTNDMDTLQQGINQSLVQLITSITSIVGVFVMMLSINVWMTLAALLILPISAFILMTVMKYSQKFFTDQQQYLGDVNGQIEEVFSGHTVVKVFNKEAAVVSVFEKTNQKLYVSGWKSQFFSGIMMPIMQFVGNLGYVMVAILGGFMVIRGAIEVGDIQAFFQYIRNFTQPMQQIAQVTNMLQSAAAASERIFEFLEVEEEEQMAVNPVTLEGIKGEVCFEHVSFGYQPEQMIIHDFTVQVKEGQKVAIVGPTGAGKTTMVKLLMRFYDVNAGAIQVDGHNIKDFNRSDLRKMFGMVLQETWLFHGTIMENIRYGRLDATEEEVIAAAKAAHAHHFIMAQPGGYDMVLNEETNNISQGQKQLLTIARAILADNKIMILDEATSSVDTRTEIRIQRAMDNLMEGRTSFVIAHRLSTIRDADMILVMKDGDIVEQGKHEELLRAGGFYANLYNSQFERAEAV